MISINKNMGLVANRSKKNKSEIKKSKEEEVDLRIDNNERTTFYVNNFIKTRYRRRRIDTSVKIKK
jgi:lipid II:glycine glycyltransferase (peptidoglycan interpeptide bridge formation enzyme)